MHSYHYDLGGLKPQFSNHTGWALHINGDPIPSVCLINPMGEPYDYTWPTFRASTEELTIFIMADMLDAIGKDGLSMATMKAQKIDNVLKLTAIVKEEKDDADEIFVPFEIVKNFVDEIIREKFVSYMEDRNDRMMSIMAAIGAFVLLTTKE